MANLTIVIDDGVLRRARMRALEQGTSVNALLRDDLVGYSQADRELSARREFAALARTSTASSGPAGRAWTRDDLYDRNAS
ncbi:hypothetical protein [Microbacterium sp.]|uniref:hypothetical protein n=1 Tax=Microbacterium sp. TaxID=51671 RepID=UPI0039E6D1D9